MRPRLSGGHPWDRGVNHILFLSSRRSRVGSDRCRFPAKAHKLAGKTGVVLALGGGVPLVEAETACDEGVDFLQFMRRSDRLWDMSSLQQGTSPMIKSLVAAALIIGLAGYAFAQETVPDPWGGGHRGGAGGSVPGCDQDCRGPGSETARASRERRTRRDSLWRAANCGKRTTS